MSFNEHSGGIRMPNQALAIFGAGALALGVGAGVGYEVIHTLNNDVNSVANGIGHFISAGKPQENVMGDAQTAISSVHIPTSKYILYAPSEGVATVKEWTTLLGVKVPGTTKYASVMESNNAQLMASPNAIISQKVRELPGSTTADPKFGAVITVNVDSLYPAYGGSQTLSVQTSDGILSRTKNVVTDNSPDGKNTSTAINIANNRLEVECAQTIAPVVQASIQQDFYMNAKQGKPDIAVLQPVDRKIVANYYKAIADESMPVKVDLVNSTGQFVPTSYGLNDASYYMSNDKIAHELGVSSSDMSFTFSGGCLSKAKAVANQVAMEESYVAHSGDSATEVASANNVTSNG